MTSFSPQGDRLNVFTISLPALRERGDDIELLSKYFVGKFARKYRKPVPELTAEALRRLRNYTWPGNIRELSHVMESVTLLNDTGKIKAHHLGLSSGAPVPGAATGEVPEEFDILQESNSLASIERRLIEQALEHTGGNVSEAAKLLGLSRGALRRRLEHLDPAK